MQTSNDPKQQHEQEKKSVTEESPGEEKSDGAETGGLPDGSGTTRKGSGGQGQEDGGQSFDAG